MWTAKPPQVDQVDETHTEPSAEKPPTSGPRCLQPSSFASRAAKAAENAAITSRRRLVSLGKSEFHERTSNGDTRVLDCELFMDYDNPSDRFVSFEGKLGLHPLQSYDNREQVTKLPPLRGGFSRPVGAFEDSPEPPPPRPV